MKKLETIIVLFIIIFVLGMAVLIAMDGGQEELPAETNGDGYVYLVDEEASSIVAISYIYKGAEPIQLRHASKWFLADDDTMPLNQTTVATLANAMSTVAANRKLVDSAEDYEQYGLANPDTQITITYKDGKEITFYLGKENAREEGTQYLKMSDSDAVYLVSTNMTAFFKYSRSELMTLDEIPEIKTSDVASINVKNPTSTGGLFTRSENDDGDVKWKVTYQNGEKVDLPDGNLGGDLLQAILAISLDDPVKCVALTDEDKVTYGLAENVYEITLNYKQKVSSSVGDSSSSATITRDMSMTFYIGAEIETEDSENRYFYLQVKESGYVYRVMMTDSMLLMSELSEAE